MTVKRIVLLAVGGLTLGYGGAAAQQVADTVELADIVVTATKSPTPVARVASPVTVIDGERLRAEGIRYVGEALQLIGSANLVATGSYGGVTSLFFRGGESDYVKVLLDGIPVNEPGGSFNWGHLTTENIDRIEVVRGPGSVLYGSDAMTGVVQIFTRRGAGPAAVEGKLQGGSFESIDGAVGISGGGEAAEYSATVGYHTTDGIYEFNNRYRNATASARLETRLSGSSRAAVTFRGRDYRNNFPTDGTGQLVDSNQFGFGTTLALGLELGNRFNEKLDAQLSLSYASAETGFDNQPDSPADTSGFGFQQRTSATTLRRFADLRADYLVSSQVRLTAGVDYAHDRGRSNGVVISNFGFGIDTSLVGPTDEGRGNAGAYLQGSVEPSRSLSLLAGVRLDENDQFGTFGTYRLGGVLRLNGGTRVRGTFGTGFKAPTFAENFARTPFEVGNSDLAPEESVSWEVGVEQSVARGRVVVGANYFDQRFRDMILYQFVADTAPSYFNLGGATARGAELELKYFVIPELQLRGSYTFLETKVTEAAGNTDPNTGFAEGQPLLRRPRHRFAAGVTSRLSGAWLALDLDYTGKRDDIDFGSFPGQRVALDSYLLVTLAASFDLLSREASRLTATLRVENLLDEDYLTVVGFPGRGRAAFAGLAFRL